MSKLSRILIMAAIVGAASQQGVTYLPVIDRKPLPKYKGESPKCKTCRYFKSDRVCLDPMQMACPRYERKKKKK